MADFYANVRVDVEVEEFFEEMSTREKQRMRKLLKEDKTPFDLELDPTKDQSMNGYERQLEQAFVKIMDTPHINHLQLARELEERFNL